MPGERVQRIKLVKIVELLRQESSEENPLRTSDIADKAAEMGVFVDKRTLSREVEFLNSQGFDIKTRIVGHQKGYYIEKRDFSVPELKILIDAVQAASFITDSQTGKKQASFYYFDRNEDGKKVYRKEKKRYVVEPMALIFNDDNYYLGCLWRAGKGVFP